jgi:hypothetical protein
MDPQPIATIATGDIFFPDFFFFLLPADLRVPAGESAAELKP